MVNARQEESLDSARLLPARSASEWIAVPTALDTDPSGQGAGAFGWAVNELTLPASVKVTRRLRSKGPKTGRFRRTNLREATDSDPSGQGAGAFGWAVNEGTAEAQRVARLSESNFPGVERVGMSS